MWRLLFVLASDEEDGTEMDKGGDEWMQGKTDQAP